MFLESGYVQFLPQQGFPSEVNERLTVGNNQIILSFAIVGGFSIISAAVWLFANLVNKRRVAMDVAGRLILVFSDQQLVTGIALLATAQMKICNISTYHYVTALILATISGSVHMMTLYILKDYMKKHTLVKSCRILGILTHYALSLVGLGNVWQTPVTDSRWPVSCLRAKSAFNPTPSIGYPKVVFNVVKLSIIVIYLGSVPSWSRISTDSFILCFFFANIVFVLLVEILKVRAKIKPYLDGNEDAWGFGQVMSNILLLVCFFSILEFYSGRLINVLRYGILSAC